MSEDDEERLLDIYGIAYMTALKCLDHLTYLVDRKGPDQKFYRKADRTLMRASAYILQSFADELPDVANEVLDSLQGDEQRTDLEVYMLFFMAYVAFRHQAVQ